MYNKKLTTFIALPLLVACSDNKGGGYNINQLFPKLVTVEESIDFGDVVVLYDVDYDLQIINAGRAPLSINSIAIEDNGDSTYTVIPESAEVAVDDVLSVGINFEPKTYLPYNRDLVITSNDEENPEYRIPLTGTGIDGPVPDIHIDPQYLEFGEVNQGATKTMYFQLSNVGTGVLEIGDVQIEGSEDFNIVNGFANTSYALAQSSTIIVEYTPSSEGGANAVITMNTNDPDEEEMTITLLGNGGGEFEYPIAVFDCPGEVDPPTTISFDGSDSYDPGANDPISYTWELLSKPEGSSTDFDDSDSPTTPLFVDSAGDYTVQLTVSNAIGLNSEPTICEFTAIPDESVHIELSWNKPNSDMDLHLVQRQGGEYDLFSIDTDCCWCNPTPAWGVSGNGDDPQLSLDNRVGYGPEAIHIEYPYEGTYGIFVHYFDDKGGGVSTATLKIYIDGVLSATESMILEERDMWMVGEFLFSNSVGTFIASDVDLDYSASQICD